MNLFMHRKSMSRLLVFAMVFLLFAGCSTKETQETTEAQEAATLSATMEAAEEEPPVEPMEPVLPSDAKIGIVYTESYGGFTDDFLARMEGYLTTAGIAQENIDRRECRAEEMAVTAHQLIGEGCSVLVAGNADPSVSGAITAAASEAGIPVLYFGTDPGKELRKSWEEQKIRAAYVGADNSKVAKQRADYINNLDSKKIDFNEDDEIGLIVVNGVRETEGNRINAETLEALDDIDYWVNVLDAEEEEETDEGSGEETDEVTEETDEATEEAPEETDEADADATGGDSEESEEEYEEEPDWQAEAYDEVVGKMREYGRQLELIICAGDEQAVGAFNAVSDEKRLVGHDVVILGMGSGEDILSEVAKGNIAQTFFDDSMAQAGHAAEYVLDYLRAIDVPYETLVDYVNVTVDNAQEIMDVLSATQQSDDEETDEEEAQG